MRVVTIVMLATALYGETQPGKDWVLSFSDEFAGNELDLKKWVPHGGHGGTSNAAGIELNDGHLRLVAARGPKGFEPVVVSTYGAFAQMFGRFEIRFRAPQGKGIESQVRLFPVPSGEQPSIDLLTLAGNAGEPARFENRWGTETTERSYAGSFAIPTSASADGFHVIAAEWDAGKIVWYVDGKERFRSVSGIPRQPLYLELSLAVGTANAKWPDSTTPSPSVFEVDWVRVYQRPSAAEK